MSRERWSSDSEPELSTTAPLAGTYVAYAYASIAQTVCFSMYDTCVTSYFRSEIVDPVCETRSVASPSLNP